MAPSRTESPGLASEQPVTNQVKIFPINSKTDLDKAIRQKDLQSLWSLGSSGPPPSNEPHSRHIPAVWKYEDTKALLLKAAEVVDAKEAERRAVLMINPGPKQPPFTLDTLLSAHQLLLPGEQAVCHRHTPFAVRFLIEGDAGYTAISGKKMFMKPGDLIITPQWNWHDHGNESQNNVIWLDGLNIPLFKHLPVDFTEHYDREFGANTHPSEVVSDEDAAEMKFPWSKMQSRLDVVDGDQIKLEYLLPNGDSISRTIGAYASKIIPGKSSLNIQETAGNIFQVHAGTGYTRVTSPGGDDDYELRWGKGDCFAIPAWYQYQNFAEGDGDVYLFSFSDKPLQVNLGFYRSKK